MATQNIKYPKNLKKNFSSNYRKGHGLFWPGGGYAHDVGGLQWVITSQLTAILPQNNTRHFYRPHKSRVFDRFKMNYYKY